MHAAAVRAGPRQGAERQRRRWRRRVHREEVAEPTACAAEVRGPRHRHGGGGSLHLLLLLHPELLELRHAEAALRGLVDLALLRRPRHAGGRARAGAGAEPRQLLLVVVVVVAAALLMHHLSLRLTTGRSTTGGGEGSLVRVGLG